MNVAALHHSASGATAYPLDAHHLRVVLRAAAGDLDGGTVIWRDRYSPEAEPDSRLPLTRVASDGVSDYWAATLVTGTRRVWYAFCGRAGRGVIWLEENGPAARRAECAGFQHPYICTADAALRLTLPPRGAVALTEETRAASRGDLASGATQADSRAGPLSRG